MYYHAIQQVFSVLCYLVDSIREILFVDAFIVVDMDDKNLIGDKSNVSMLGVLLNMISCVTSLS